MLLLINAERFIAALKHKIKWEIDHDRILDQVLKVQGEKLKIEDELN